MPTNPRCDFPPATVVGQRYLLQEVLGRGGYGIVYRAQDRKFAPPVAVALKFLKFHRDAAGRRWDRFIEEASLLARLNHPGLVKVTNQGIYEGFPYFVMEYLGEETLRAAIRQHRQGLPLARAANLMRQLGRTLAAVHSQHLFHCDFKPANIMLHLLPGGEEQATVIDFGIARLTDPVRAQEQNLPHEGTWKYMAPEQFNVAADSVQITAATDIYAFGIVAFQMLTGQHPFDAPNALVIHQQQQAGLRVRASQFRPELSPLVDDILRQALAYHAAERYQNAKDFAQRLTAALGVENAPLVMPSGETLPAPRVFLLAADARADQEAAAQLVRAFQTRGHTTSYTDGAVGLGVARQLDADLRQAQLCVILFSAESLGDTVWEALVTQAGELANLTGQRLRLVFLALDDDLTIPDRWRHEQVISWRTGAAESVVAEIVSGPPTAPSPTRPPAGGAIPEPPVGALRPGHPLYVERAADARFLEALEKRRSILLVRGPRQFGKTSLLSRGLEKARSAGFRVAITDCQSLDEGQFDSLKSFYLALGRNLARQLRLSRMLRDVWDDLSGPNENFAEYMRDYVLAERQPHLLWALDEVDRVFAYPYRNDVFAMFRSWHNARSNDTAEGRAWGRLTLTIGYATEASRFISDLHQSPFNVGIKCDLPSFDGAQTADLNRRYGSPVRDESELAEFHAYTGGHPALTQQGLGILARRGEGGWAELRQEAARHEGPFGDHLRRLADIVRGHPRMQTGLVKLLQADGKLTTDEFYDLWAPGLIAGQDPSEAQLGSQLYADFFRRALSVTPHQPKPAGWWERLKQVIASS